jgi:hypothetical protein
MSYKYNKYYLSCFINYISAKINKDVNLMLEIIVWAIKVLKGKHLLMLK